MWYVLDEFLGDFFQELVWRVACIEVFFFLVFYNFMDGMKLQKKGNPKREITKGLPNWRREERREEKSSYRGGKRGEQLQQETTLLIIA